MQVLQKRIEDNKALLQAKEAEVSQLQEERASLQPLADYTREVLQSTDTYTLTQTAKALGYKSAIQLTRVLRDKGILYKQSGTWMPKSKYSGEVLGYFKTRTHRFFRSDGSVGTSHITVVTERGVSFLHSILK
jgi:phage antirepressor YoqD-like protein